MVAQVIKYARVIYIASYFTSFLKVVTEFDVNFVWLSAPNAILITIPIRCRVSFRLSGLKCLPCLSKFVSKF